MALSNVLRKMFGGAREDFDESGQPVRRATIEEQLLERHLQREHHKKVRTALRYYEDKHWKEMTFQPKPNYPNKFRRRN